MSTTLTPTTPIADRTGGAVAMIVGSCVSLQFGAAVAVRLFPTIGTWGATTLRLGLAAVVLALASRVSVRGWTRRQWLSVISLGVVLAGMNGSFYAAIGRIPLAVAVSIELLGPLILAAVLSRRRTDLLWVALAFGGMALLGLEAATGAMTFDLIGVAFALTAGLFWAFYILCSAGVGKQVPGTGGLAVALGVSSLVVLPIGGHAAVQIVDDPVLLGLALLMAILASVIPYTLELAALRRIPQRVFGVLLSLEPVVAAVAGWLLLHQGVSPLRLVAIALVIIASVGVTVTAGRATAVHSPT